MEQEFGPDVTTNEHIEQVIADGPGWNRTTALILEGLIPAGSLGHLLGQVSKGAGIRIGVFDH